MTPKSKKIMAGILIGLAVLIISLNYVSSEIYSLKYWNPVRKVYFKNSIVRAEVVKEEDKIRTGLAGRETLQKGRGMLFVMPETKFQTFWMRGMRFPIDIIWIVGGKVIGCEKNVMPDDPSVFTSPRETTYVLEVPAGFCESQGIELNDEVRL